MFAFVGDCWDLSGSSSSSDPFCSQTKADGSHLPGSPGAEPREVKTNSQPFPPPWCSNGHKSFAPSSDLAFRTIFWLVGSKGRAEPEQSYGLRYTGLAPRITYPADTVCAALTIGLS